MSSHPKTTSRNPQPISPSLRLAVKIAEETLIGIESSELNRLENDIHKIFTTWKNKHAKHISPLAKIGFDEDSRSKKTRPAELKSIKSLMPWQCCIGISTPVGLFQKLYQIQYKPLIDYLEKDYTNFEKIIAGLILESSEPTYMESECIEAALTLAEIQIGVYKGIAEGTRHIVEKYYFKRKLKANEKSQAHLPEQKNRVLESYNKIWAEGGKKPRFLSKLIGNETNLPAWTVSRVLKTLREENLLHD